jgi:hypothetical protein
MSTWTASLNATACIGPVFLSPCLMFKGGWAESEIFGVRSAASYAMMPTTALRGLSRSSARSGEAVQYGNRSA